MKAKTYFEKLGHLAPDHPALKAFEAQIGAQLTPSPPPAEAEESAPAADESAGSEPEAEASGSEPEPEVAEAEPPAEAAAEPEGEAPAAEPAEAEPKQVDEALVAELREKLQQQDEAKRYHEYVKTLVALADEVGDPAESVELYLKAADLYVNKFVNQAEAVKTFEKVIEVDPDNQDAIAYLRQMYEKRRDWEKLIALNTSQAERLESGPERTAMFKEIAQLATDRVKKPDVCIGLWAVVLDNDADDLDALGALAQFYERARDYEKLADVLEKLAELTFDTKEKVQILTKLGQVTGDRLKDDARAVDAYRTLLTLQPDDRRAQEQLKKRYVSLGRWDDLEVFYADTGKWDEFIRVLESNEARTKDTEQRIGMLMKVAELWMTQKGKPDRSARAYEKILNLDENNLAAAEQLIPIYTQGNNPKGLSGAIEVKLGHVEDADGTAGASARGRRALREPHQRQEQGFRALPVGIRDCACRRAEPGGRRTGCATDRTLGRSHRGVQEPGDACGRRRRRGARQRAPAAPRAGAGRRGAACRRRASGVPRRLRERARQYHRAGSPRTSCTGTPSAGATCSMSTGRSASSSRIPTSASRSSTRSPSCTRPRSASRLPPCRPTRRCSRTIRPTPWRSRRSIASTSRPRTGSPTPTSCVAGSSWM